MNDELTCAQAGELLAAYATDSLVEEERCAFTAHLAECRLHDEELAGYRAVTSRLPSALDPVQPRAELRGSLLRSFDSLLNAPPEPEESTSRAPRRGLMGFLSASGFAFSLAAGLAVAVIALAGFAFSQDSGEDVRKVTNAADGGRLALTYLPDRKQGIIDLDMPALPANRAYQAWQITPGGPVSLGIVANKGSTAFNADLSNATNIAITDEPLSGSQQPTTAPRLVTKF